MKLRRALLALTVVACAAAPKETPEQAEADKAFHDLCLALVEIAGLGDPRPIY